MYLLLPAAEPDPGPHSAAGTGRLPPKLLLDPPTPPLASAQWAHLRPLALPLLLLLLLLLHLFPQLLPPTLLMHWLTQLAATFPSPADSHHWLPQ